MRILIRGEGHHINIPVPTALVFSRPSVWIWMKLARKAMNHSSKYNPADAGINEDDCFAKIPDEAVYALCAELMRVKRKHGRWDLVEVESANGERVLIRL